MAYDGIHYPSQRDISTGILADLFKRRRYQTIDSLFERWGRDKPRESYDKPSLIVFGGVNLHSGGAGFQYLRAIKIGKETTPVSIHHISIQVELSAAFTDRDHRIKEADGQLTRGVFHSPICQSLFERVTIYLL
jgi:hypothetical protein